jgi:hypothetical protein
MNAPCFYLNVWSRGVTVRFAWRLFQVIPICDELFSQRQDRERIRFCGLSIKLFGL